MMLLFALLVLPLLGSDSPKDYDGASEADDIRGTWELTSIGAPGIGINMRPPSDGCVTTFRGGTYTNRYYDGETIHGSYCVAPCRKPSHLDLRPSGGIYRGQTWKKIYEIEGATLRVAHDTDADCRPEGFSDRHVILLIYKRVKK
jgi:uncharacterized protein (TIGR03067 family)